jgi:hypothetical protein
MKWNKGDTHECTWTGWLYIKCWKWLPPSTWQIWNRRFKSPVFCLRTSLPVLVISSQISYKASIVWGLFLYIISFRYPKRNKFGDIKFHDREVHDFLDAMILSCSVTNTHAIKTSPTQPQILRPRQISHEHYRHERATLLKQVSTASDHSFKNCRQNHLGVIWIALYIRFIDVSLRMAIYRCNV